MRRAYVTMICGGDGYLPGVEVLGTSLDLCGTTVPKVVMVTEDVSAVARERLIQRGWIVHPVESIANPGPDRLLFPRFANVYTKLRAWELTDFDRVVFLDADTLVMTNVDELFERPHFAAAPDFFLPDRFNSGVMVLDPSQRLFNEMAAALTGSATYDGGDQGFLNSFFPNWYGMPVEHRLSAGYNLPNFIYQYGLGHPALSSTVEHDVRIIHYLVQKPWKARATLTGGSGPWWKMYFAAHPEQANDWKSKVHSAEDWTFEHLSAFVTG